MQKVGSSSVPHGCPCGYYGDSKHNCRCTPLQIQNYRNKISGPLLDRIDIHIEVPSVRYQELASTGTGEPSAAIRVRVLAARAAQQERFKGPVLSLSKGLRKVRCNAAMRTKELHKHCALKPDAQAQLKNGHHGTEFQCAGLRPHPEGGAHHCRPGRLRGHPDRARLRSNPVP